MDDSVYSVIAYIARYWFAFLAIVIIWRAINWVRKDADYVSHTQSKLPDAGFIGEWAVVASEAEEVPAGLVMRASQDGWIGSARGCDIRLKDRNVPARAARFVLREDGLHLLPQRRNAIMVDGQPVQREAVLRHGATLTVGSITMQLRLFAGVLLKGEKLAAPIDIPIYMEEIDEEDVYYDEDDDFDEEEYDLYEEDDDFDDPPPPKMALPRPNMTYRANQRRR